MNELGLVWLRRDLRLTDNTALSAALKSCKKLVLVFVFDHHILGELTVKDDKRVYFIWQSLLAMRAELRRKHGSDLLIMQGDPATLIPALASQLKANAVYTNRDYESYALNRDRDVQAWLHELGIHFMTFKDQVIFEQLEVSKPTGGAYTVFTPYKKRWLAKLAQEPESIAERSCALSSELLLDQVELQAQLAVVEAAGLSLVRELTDIGFEVPTGPTVPEGEENARAQLQAYASDKMSSYKDRRDFPAQEGTSNLSVHLRFGTVSARQCFRASRALWEQASLEQRGQIEVWESELIWREFYSSILQAFPHVQYGPFKPEYKKLTWRVDERLFEAWTEGQTGYPIIDAGMRQLKATGQMHNRLRMIVASFLTKDLLINWQRGEEHFAKYLLDFDLASNNGGWQWAASTGTDAVPYFRVFNPSLQGQRFDSEAAYIKKWVPELKQVGAAHLHSLSFQVPGYPAPIVRHEEARKAVLAMFAALKSKSPD